MYYISVYRIESVSVEFLLEEYEDVRDPGSIYFDKARMMTAWIKADAAMQIRHREERAAKELREQARKEAMIGELRRQMSDLQRLQKHHHGHHGSLDTAESFENQMKLAQTVALTGEENSVSFMLLTVLRYYKNYLIGGLIVLAIFLFRFLFRKQLVVAGRIQSHAMHRFLSNYDDNVVKRV